MLLLMRQRGKNEQRRTLDFGNDFMDSYSAKAGDFEDVSLVKEGGVESLRWTVHACRPRRDHGVSTGFSHLCS